ncbi:MAG: cytidylate kinase-like family protein [Lachnospiraceae bacterium]|nr:cytidylate kinase-like family protein [Lachnospiraceae bacterium]MDD3794379.1 cytidylate kinase-like family protein [Lachnospiraceae bacterium]
MAENMIITIGRQFGSGGHEVGKRLASELGIKLYDKELLKLVAEESGICEKVLENYDEKPTNSLLYSIAMDVYPSMNYVGASINQQIYQAQFDTIKKLENAGSCVIVGRGADYILRDYKNLVTVFVHADLAYRMKRVAEYEHIPETKARDIIVKADKKRASFYNFQTEKKWGAASSYNLSVDSSAIGIDGAVELIKTFAKMKMEH